MHGYFYESIFAVNQEWRSLPYLLWKALEISLVEHSHVIIPAVEDRGEMRQFTLNLRGNRHLDPR